MGEGGCEGQTGMMEVKKKKCGRIIKQKIHVNSNGMCGVRLGEIYNLILGALCEHMGVGWGGGSACLACVGPCLMSMSMPEQVEEEEPVLHPGSLFML